MIVEDILNSLLRCCMFDLDLLESQSFFLSIIRRMSPHAFTVSESAYRVHILRCLSILWVQLTPVSTMRSHFLIKVHRDISWILPRIIWSMNQNHHHESSYGIDGSWDLRSRSLLFWGRVCASDHSSIPILSFCLAPPISFLRFLPFTKIPA